MERLAHLDFDAPLEAYERQAWELLEGHRTGDPAALRLIHHHDPRFLDSEVKWLPRRLSEAEIRAAAFDEADAKRTLSRWYDFLDWKSLSVHVEAVCRRESETHFFEAAVEAVVDGDLNGLKALLVARPELVRARSARVTHFDPPVHRAALLHYIAANGVEGYRQKTPANAVEMARTLLDAGAGANDLARLYGGECTTMSLLVSSSHPAQAGLQVALVDVLVDYGASVDARGAGNWVSPLLTALVFCYLDAARALVRRGARVDDVAAAAGLGLVQETRKLLAGSSEISRHQALALAAQNGHTEVVRLLLDAGEDPNRFNPKGFHAHATPLHQAALAGHEDVVRLLVDRGANLDIEDAIWHGTPCGWANHAGHANIAEFLRSKE